VKVLTKPFPARRIHQAPCPHHGAALVHDGKPCVVVGVASNRHLTWRCGRWKHMDAVRLAVKK
jgi:hypothetical protein